MHKPFEIAYPFHVPDRTLVSPFLGSQDSLSGLPFNLLDGFSLAAGVVGSNQESKLTEPATIFQLINNTSEPGKVL